MKLKIQESRVWVARVIKEMNRVGLVIDMSHSAERSTMEAIELSDRPIAITHANPASWHPALRNKPDDVLRALGQIRWQCSGFQSIHTI